MAAVATIFNVVTLIVGSFCCYHCMLGFVLVVIDFWPIFTVKNHCIRQRSHRGLVEVDKGTK